GADLRLRGGGAGAHSHHLGRHVRVAHPQRFLHRDLVERVGAVVHSLGDDPGVVRLHLDPGLVVLDPFDGDQNLHDDPPFAGRSPRTSHCATSAPVFFSGDRLPLISHPRASSSSAPKIARFTVAGETFPSSSPRSCPSRTTSAIRST